MVILVVALIVIIAGVGAVLYFYYPKVLGIELPGYQFSQIVDNGNYYSLQRLSMNENNATFAIFNTNQYGRVNWQSPTITISAIPIFGLWLVSETTPFVLHADRLYFCFISEQAYCQNLTSEKMTSNFILTFNASNGEPEAINQYNISINSDPDFVISDNNTFYFGALTSTVNGNIDIDAYNFNDNGIVSQLWNYTIANVSNGGWGTGSDIVGLSNGYLNVTFLRGNLAGQTFLLNVSTGELMH